MPFKLFADLGSTIKSAIFLFSSPLRLSQGFCHSVLYSVSFYLKLSGRYGTNCLLFTPLLSGYNGSPDIRFFWGTTPLMNWPGVVRYSRTPQSLVVSLLLSFVFTLAFSRTGGVLSHGNSMTHRFPRFPSRNFCSLVTLALFSFVFTATNTAFC